MVKAGIFVNIANPKHIPESATIVAFFFFTISLLLLLYALYLAKKTANKIESRRKGNSRESRYTFDRNDVDGVTEKRIEAMNPTFLLLYLSSAISYNRNVSTTASNAIIILGTSQSISIECISPLAEG